MNDLENLDGDGAISEDGRLWFTSKDRRLLEHVQKLLGSLVEADRLAKE